jgi:hypothetical protein
MSLSVSLLKDGHMKEITGYTYEERGRLYARPHIDRRNRQAEESKATCRHSKHVKAILRHLRSELEKGGSRAIEAGRMSLQVEIR